MLLTVKNIFGPDERQEGVTKINIYLLRLFFLLMFLVVGKLPGPISSHSRVQRVLEKLWHGVFGHLTPCYLSSGSYDLSRCCPWYCLNFSKVLWLVVVVYLLGSTNQLIGSPANKLTSTFLWVLLPIIAMPWKYAFETYVYKPKKNTVAIL